MYNWDINAIHLKHEAVNVADEVFLVVADLQRRNPAAEDFSVREILDHAQEMNLTGRLRPGFEVHVRQHSVANKPPNGGRYRTLYATGKARRRLLLPTDYVHPQRSGKIWPLPEEVPQEFRSLVPWAMARFGRVKAEQPLVHPLLALRGSGRELWSDESADEYVGRLRADWL